MNLPTPVPSPVLRSGAFRPTLKEIASIAKVDISTVSRAINDSPLITRETKATVLAIAERMNYFPNSLARGLVNQKSETLGIILPTISFLQGPFFSQLLAGLEQASIESGYNILIASATHRDRDKHFPFNLTRARRIDGMLIMNEQHKIGNLPALKKEKFPFVFMNRDIDDSEVYCVAMDNVQGGRLATQHLLDLGHTRIGFVTGNADMAVTQARREGIRQALEAHGMILDEEMVVEGLFENGIDTGAQCAMRLLKAKRRPTAIFAFSDELAIGVMQTARNLGMRMPEDLAIVGYDNIEYGAHLNPPLTTISQDPFAIGATSCRMLIEMLNGKMPENRHVKIPVKLVVRNSSGQPSRE